MIKNFWTLFTFILFSIFLNTKGQTGINKNLPIDGIVAVIGNEIVLESDIEEYINIARQQGTKMDDKCKVVEDIVHDKVLLFHAKNDTLIQDRSKELKANAESRYQQLLSGFSSEKDMLSAYKFRTEYELKSAIERIALDQYYQNEKYRMITKDIDVTPSEVSTFYQTNKDRLPYVYDEVKLNRIIMYPKLTETHKQEIINRLKSIKSTILSGESSFESQAIIYSEDPGSASNGGLISNISKGMMVKAFEATALNLEEGEISDHVETEFGYHIIRLEKKAGKKYDVRHILILSTPNAEEIEAAKEEMINIKTQITEGKITFKEAALKYSDDKYTKFNAGVMTGENGSDSIEKTKLNPIDAYQIAGLEKGEITDPYENEEEQSKKKNITIIQIADIIPAHNMDIDTDYERIRTIALNKKRNENIEKWIKSKLPYTFISINKRYNECNFKTDWTMKNYSVK